MPARENADEAALKSGPDQHIRLKQINRQHSYCNCARHWLLLILTLSKPERILKKYYDKNNEYIFPVLQEPFINRHLKVIAGEAKIPFKVSFHTARHSFGTYMAGKIPLPQLMCLMQHSDIKTTMIYVNINQDMVKQGLMKVDW